ncbi:MAG: hypothetical protein HQP61_10240 [Peptococcaceae bacterium]|nr:hypothetical protein [Candidatus Syntrophopropionicum ammoniitolerans]
MNKKWYKLVFRQEEPIHIGKGSYGVLSETRIIIPGWTIWGALVNKYVKDKNGTENYEKTGKLFEVISCFYPSIGEKGSVLFPEYRKGQFCLGEYTEEDFRAMFVDVNVSTAIEPETRATKDVSLHEVEAILHKPKDSLKSQFKQLHWTGLLGIRNNSEDILGFLRKGMKIIVGGEGRYGFGRMELVNIEGIEDLCDWGIDLEGRPTTDIPLRNYMEYCDGCLKLGELEHIIVDADFSKATPTIKNSKICLVPGSIANATGRLIKGIYHQ